MFGANGHITKPEGGVLENYTMRATDNAPLNHHIKTICDTSRVLSIPGDHFPLYRFGFLNLDENGSITYGTHTQEVHFAKIRINHYFTKSREEFIAKRNRGMADHISGLRSLSEFETHNTNDLPDTEILSRA